MARSPKKPPVLESEDHIGFERIVFFSDAVFAIAITLLALEVRLPDVPPADFPRALGALLPEIGAYALSFLIVGLYWVGHHRMFRIIVRYDYTLIWLNLFFLLCIAFLPVASNIIGHYQHPLAVLVYCAVLALTSLINMLAWWYASHNHRLTPPHIAPNVGRQVFTRSAATIGVAFLAAGIGFLDTAAALLVLGIYAIVAIISGWFAR